LFGYGRHGTYLDKVKTKKKKKKKKESKIDRFVRPNHRLAVHRDWRRFVSLTTRCRRFAARTRSIADLVLPGSVVRVDVCAYDLTKTAPSLNPKRELHFEATCVVISASW